jgi:Cysteine rich repeat
MSMIRLRVLPFQFGVVAGVAVAAGALPAVAQAPAPPQMRSEAMAIMALCRSDYDRLCSGVRPGGGRILACLQSHAGALSPACGRAMPRAQVLKDNAAAAGVLPR